MKVSFYLSIMMVTGSIAIPSMIITSYLIDQNNELYRITLPLAVFTFAPMLIIGIWFVLFYDDNDLYQIESKAPITLETNLDAKNG